MGIQVVNYTPGTASNADYTTPDMKNYRSSQSIYDQIMALEKKEGLNGHLMLIHFGTHDDRTYKFYNGYMEKMIKTLLDKGHYVGGHSYGHLLYMPWENPDSLLVTREEFEADMMKSYDLIRKAGIEYKDAPLYIPP